MKNLFTLILMLSLPLVTFSQNDSKTESSDVINSDKLEIIDSKNELQQKKSEVVKAKLIELNYKKSYELISINSFRKSLQIKIKTIKNC